MRHLRKGSPAPGGSILTTSAPKSASVLEANGPAISWPSSRTLIPANAAAPDPGVVEVHVDVVMPRSLRAWSRKVYYFLVERAFASREGEHK
jgi:hypothetical protein